ncbi:MAG: hypothetical protein HPY66_2906 [Firmicutes bacterium]|nr:hypothetical protein [Bacillota bacterium]MDI6705342.1 hypothetical protein [Bacillota bacterium]
MIRHEGIAYLDSEEIYYHHCHLGQDDEKAFTNKWYKVICILRLDKLPNHKNTYYMPNHKLDRFLRNNPEEVLHIEPVDEKEVAGIIGLYSNSSTASQTGDGID